MPTAIKSLKGVLVDLLWFGLTFALFRYVARFSGVQSIVLAAVGTYAIRGSMLAFKIATTQPPQFEPFWISIKPNWHALCQDLGLADAEKLAEAVEQREPESAYSVIRDGVNFTMLGPALFYSNDHHSFFRELDFCEILEELGDEGGLLAPQFYIKRKRMGEKDNIPVIEFGIRTPESLKKIGNPTEGKANIVAARLPEVLFYEYYDSEFDYSRSRRIDKESKLRLAEFGWTQEDLDLEEFSPRSPFEVQHKYVWVMYRGIS
jgi:hypothetical protein